MHKNKSTRSEFLTALMKTIGGDSGIALISAYNGTSTEAFRNEMDKISSHLITTMPNINKINITSIKKNWADWDAKHYVSKDSKGIALEAAQLARREHPKSSNPNVDRILAKETYLQDLARKAPEHAKVIADSLRKDPEGHSEVAGVSPDHIKAYASIIERQLGLKKSDTSSYANILKGGVGSGRYKVTITDKTDSKNHTNHDYIVNKAKDINHATNIAMIIHRKKLPKSTNFSSSYQQVKQLP